MMTLLLNAVEDSGSYNLGFTRQDDGEISVSLVGIHNGENIQLDFDALNETDMEEFIAYLQRRKKVKEDVGGHT